MSPAQSVEVIASLSLQAAAIITVAHFAARFARHDAIRCRIWEASHVMLLVLVAAALLLPHVRWFSPWPALSIDSVAQAATLQQQFGIALVAVWAIGAMVSMLLFLIGWWRISRFLQTCEPVSDAAVLATVEGTNGTHAAPRMLCSPFLNTPFCWQIHRPAIVIPEFLLEFEPAELRFIIQHELEHLRAAHPLNLFVQRLVEILFWFHPMIWWSSQQAALSREFACDAASVHGVDDVADYLRVLLKVVERQVDDHDLPSVDLAFGRGKTSVARRAVHLTGLAQRACFAAAPSLGERMLLPLVGAAALAATMLWLPLDVLGSPNSPLSPWPRWTAETLHTFGVHARDYEIYSRRTRHVEAIEAAAKQ